MVIPELEIESRFINGENNLVYRTNGNQTEFLNHNPEIWLFRFNRKRGRIFYNLKAHNPTSDKYRHNPHQGGVKYADPVLKSYFAGGSNFARNTEFGYTHNTKENTKLNVVPTDWINIAPNFIKNHLKGIRSNYKYIKKTEGTKVNKTPEIKMAVCIVINNPKYISFGATPNEFPKIYGKKSYFTLYGVYESSKLPQNSQNIHHFKFKVST